jgi:hypothetical protein
MDTKTDVASPCNSTAYTPTGSTLTLEWGEGFGANGADDSRNVVVEVWQTGGTCPPPSPWTLKVERSP